jgi:hypothetical protein
MCAGGAWPPQAAATGAQGCGLACRVAWAPPARTHARTHARMHAHTWAVWQGDAANLLVPQPLDTGWLRACARNRRRQRCTCSRHAPHRCRTCWHKDSARGDTCTTLQLQPRQLPRCPHAPELTIAAPLMPPAAATSALASRNARCIWEWGSNRDRGLPGARAPRCCCAVACRCGGCARPARSTTVCAEGPRRLHALWGALCGRNLAQTRTCSHSCRPLGPILCFLVAILLSHCQGASRLSSLSDMALYRLRSTQWSACARALRPQLAGGHSEVQVLLSADGWCDGRGLCNTLTPPTAGYAVSRATAWLLHARRHTPASKFQHGGVT